MAEEDSIKTDRVEGMLKGLRQEQKFLLLILAIGAVLRLWHIGWGLPDLYEEATPLVKSWKMWNWGAQGFEFNPHFFNYPALTFYLNFLLQALEFAFGYLFGFYRNLQSFGADLSSIVVPSRLLTAAFDVGTIYCTYLLAKKVAGEPAALIAAALVALNPLHIEQAHYITVDTPLTFFVVLALLNIDRAIGSSDRKTYLAAGLSIGLAAATKYTGALLLPVLVILQMLSSDSVDKAMRSLKEGNLWLAIGSAVGLFLLINPFIILSYDEFVRDFSFEQYHVSYGHLGLDPGQSTIDYYFFNVLLKNFGWPMFLLLGLTLVMLIVRKKRHHLAMLVFPFLYIVIISSWQMRASRYMLPMIPALLIVCAHGLTLFRERFTDAVKRAASKLRMDERKATIGAACLLGLIFLGQPLALDYSFQRSIDSQDTRTITKEWILKHLRPGGAIATGPIGIQLPDTLYRVLFIPFLAQEAERIAAFYDTRWYEDCDLLIASDFDYSRYRMEPKRYAEFLPYYDTLKTQWSLLLEVKPKEFQQGPTIWLYSPENVPRKRTLDSSLFSKLETVPESLKVSNFLRELSLVLIEKGEYNKAEQALRNLVSVETTNLPARFTLARVLFTLGKFDQALLQAQKIVYQDQSRPEVYVLAGDLLLRLGRGREGEQSFLKALQLNNAYEPAYEDLLGYYTDLNDQSKLLAILKRYYSILPKGSKQAEAVAGRIRALENPS